MTRFPLRYARRNVLIGPGGEAAALYRADTVAYPFLPTSQKWALLHRLERFAHLAGADFSHLAGPALLPGRALSRRARRARSTPSTATPRCWRRYLQGHEARLRELGSHVPEVYLAVSLVEGEGGPGALRSFGRVRRRVEELAGVGRPPPISGAELEALAAVEQRTFERLSGAIALQRASTRELHWLLRRAACRGVAEPALDRHWEPDALVVVAPDGSAAYEPLERDLWRCANAPATEDPGEPPSLVVEAEEGTSCQAFLCAGSLAEEAEFPGAAELLFGPAEGAGFPVDAVLYAQWIGNREALGQVRKRILDVEHAYREQLEGASGPGVLAEEDRELAREYEAILQSSAHPPMLRASISLALGAPERESWSGGSTTLRERFGEVALHRPRGLQHALFARPPAAAGRRRGARLPPADDRRAVRRDGRHRQHRGRLPRRHLHRLTPRRAARCASTRPRRRARRAPRACCSPARSARARRSPRRRSPTPPSGAAAWSSTSTPSPTTASTGCPSWRARSRCWSSPATRSTAASSTRLHIGLPELREELAASYLIELLRDPPPAWENAIDRAVRDAVRAGERSLMRVVDRLRSSDADAASRGGRGAGGAL